MVLEPRFGGLLCSFGVSWGSGGPTLLQKLIRNTFFKIRMFSLYLINTSLGALLGGTLARFEPVGFPRQGTETTPHL